MNGTVIVRKADKADAPAIFTLYGALEAAYGEHGDKSGQDYVQAWDEVAGDKRQHILVAETEGTVVGTVILVVVPNLGHHGQPWASVTNLAVAEAGRGQGIGTQLLAEAGRIAREHNCYKIVLSTNLVREQAHEFYRKLGWRQSHIGFSLELN
jgi:GNAT superfamily N-acetyltransferase